MAVEREVTEEKQIPRFAGDDKDGKRQQRDSTDVKVGHYKT